MTASLPIAAPSVPGDDSAVRRRALLGVGVRADLVSTADTARDLVLRRTATGVDLDLVDGVDTLCQDLAVGLTTLQGSDPFNLQFGFRGLQPLVDQTSPVLARETLRAAVVQLVAADPRVRRVVEVSTASTDNSSRRLDLTVTFEAVTGDRVTVNTGGLGSGAAFGVLDTPGFDAVSGSGVAR
jgi:phage baseplate assembly protein W